MSSISSVGPRTLADVIPGGLVRNLVLIVGAAGFVGLAAQVKLYLPFTPVPLTLQTFAVLLSAAVLGGNRAAASLGLYLALGVAGVPWFANQASGWAFASFGYLLGFVVAAYLVGRLAERGADRTPLKTAGLMVLGNVVVYAAGVPWLMAFLGADLGKALTLGVAPFLIGDVIKIVLAAGLLPATWALVRRSGRD
ncbi:biotin transporter BioY [Microlunatus sp. GCM10028923]|uniref:biotin transporter BioY n=1 Tax=Microlunatus sp. GCM10028923 TaxID=3273400 RepID=UPI00361181D3